ncbi:MAG: hypothetical protein M3O46_08090 [Myxococcota bacterium]|nr:hypothetical protein [Myxococcota bacterium]
MRVVETIDDAAEVRRTGECLLSVWPSPLYETSTCSQWVRRGAFQVRNPVVGRPSGQPRLLRSLPVTKVPFTLPKDLLDMDADEFRRVLSEVIRDELGVGEIEIAGKWQGGEMILKPGKEGLQEKRMPLEALFRKIVMIRDKLRVLEQRINSHPKLGDEDKIQLQQYVTGCYGTLTTFNVLFAERENQFVGQKGDP